MTSHIAREINSIFQGILLAGHEMERKREESKPEQLAKVEPACSPGNGDRPQKLDREQILAELEKCQNHRGRTRTAEFLGISRKQLQYKIKEYHISERCRYDE